MLGERDAVVAEVRPYDVHGSPHVQVALAFADQTFQQVQLGAESVPADLRPGDPVVVRLAMNVVVGIERPAAGPSLVGRPLFADGLDALERLAEVRKPLLLLLGDETNAPRERVAPGSGDARVDERVQHGALRHPQDASWPASQAS